MYRVCGSRLDPNLGVRPAADKEFYLRLTFEKMNASAAFSEKYFRPYGCSDTNFTAAVSIADPRIEIQSQINKTEIIAIQI